MSEKFNDWIEETSTKEKEEIILNYLSHIGNDDKESKKLVDAYLFDADNIPVYSPDVDELFDALDIDKDDFVEYI
jgi:hypothetical protein